MRTSTRASTKRKSQSEQSVMTSEQHSTVVAYVRVSTDNQAGEDRFGIESQQQMIRDYCAKHNMTISSWYIDKGESGVKENRPELDKLLYGEIENPPVEAVIVAKSDRVARDIKLYYYFMMLLEKKGMKLISATEEVVNDDTGLGSVYKALILFVAEQERQNINKRTSGGRNVKACKGGYSGGHSPYGYFVRDHALVVDPVQAVVVVEIFRLRDAGRTYQEIADVLNSEGAVTRSGGKWTTSSIQVILGNRKTYQGWYRYSDGDWVEGQHQAILPREE